MRRRVSRLAAVALIGALHVSGAGPAAGQTTTTEATPTTTVPLGQPPPAPEGPGDGTHSRQLPVTASPATGLLDGQVIQVAGSGFTPGALLGVVTCTVAADGGGVSHCDLSHYGSPHAGDDGTFTSTYELRRIIYTEADGEVDCGGAPQACIVAVANTTDYDESGGASIDFDASFPPPPAPTLTLDPATGLVDGQRVTVTGSGFEPDAFLLLSQCALEGAVVRQATCEYGDVDGRGEVGPDGTFTASTVVHRLLFDGFEPVDCAATPCAFVTGRPLGTGRSVQALLAFDPSAPPPPSPTLELSPGNGLVDGQRVVVTGTGFRPGEQPYLIQCLAGTTAGDELDFGNCAEGLIGEPSDVYFLPVAAGADGRFTQRVTVDRFLVGDDGEVDCGSERGRCELRTGIYDEGTPARAGLNFDPDVPAPPPPSLQVDPGTGFTGRQVVHLDGSGFDPGGYHVVLQCVAGEGAPEYGDCDERSQLDLPVAPDGSVDTSTRLRRTVRTQAGTIDCAEAPGRCELYSGFPFGGGRPASVALTFDPERPREPKAAVTVAPGRDLVDGQEVTVSGTNLLPERPVAVSECPVAPPDAFLVPVGCSPYGYLIIGEDDEGEGPTQPVVDDDGTFSTTLVVTRVVVTAEEELDCVDGAGCTVVASQGERRPATTALAFDAAAPPPPPATLAVEPADGLADGQQVTVTGTGFRPGSEVYVVQCTAGGRRLARCSRLAGEGDVDADGVLTGTVEVRREIGYDEPIDCATVEGGCTLETGVALDGARISAAPITFDPAAPPAPPPAVGVTPTTDLSDGQEVTVRASGFTPGTPVGALQCSALDPEDRYLRRCDLSTAVVVEADDTGAVSTPLVVRAAIATQTDGVRDCRTTATPCALVVVSLVADRDRAGVPLTFVSAPASSSVASLRAAAGAPARGGGWVPEAYLGAAGQALRDPRTGGLERSTGVSGPATSAP